MDEQSFGVVTLVSEESAQKESVSILNQLRLNGSNTQDDDPFRLKSLDMKIAELRIQAEKASTSNDTSRILTQRILAKLSHHQTSTGKDQELEGVVDKLLEENQLLRTALQDQVSANHYQQTELKEVKQMLAEARDKMASIVQFYDDLITSGGKVKAKPDFFDLTDGKEVAFHAKAVEHLSQVRQIRVTNKKLYGQLVQVREEVLGLKQATEQHQLMYASSGTLVVDSISSMGNAAVLRAAETAAQSQTSSQLQQQPHQLASNKLSSVASPQLFASNESQLEQQRTTVGQQRKQLLPQKLYRNLQKQLVKQLKRSTTPAYTMKASQSVQEHQEYSSGQASSAAMASTDRVSTKRAPIHLTFDRPKTPTPLLSKLSRHQAKPLQARSATRISSSSGSNDALKHNEIGTKLAERQLVVFSRNAAPTTKLSSSLTHQTTL